MNTIFTDTEITEPAGGKSCEWWRHSIFYHIYTLGFCEAPERNDFASPAEPRLDAVAEAAGHIRRLGCDAVYLGPLFESTSHGYDTVDHYHVDRRLGNNDTLRSVVRRLHENGLRVVLDGVFNHTSRDHFAFFDLRQRGAASPYRDWFKAVDFSANNRFGDGFTYRAWEGHEELPELNLDNREMREHLFGAVAQMIDDFEIDGLRLDVAYALPPDFLRELREFTTRGKGFFLLGEIIHGEYDRFAAETGLHSLTNYETYKALWSAHNDRNYFELAHSLERNFGQANGSGGRACNDNGGGPGADCKPVLYNFADNHDVNRVASKLDNPRHLFPLYALLFTIPGIPSIYYGSEFGIEGRRSEHSDAALRPAWTEVLWRRETADAAPELSAFIAELAELRRRSTALCGGSYRPLYLDHHIIAFERVTEEERIVVVVSSLGEQTTISLSVESHSSAAEDMFRPGTFVPVKGSVLELSLPAYGSMVLSLGRGGGV
ncbi:MAG: alpha-amylase family glycosyl hydrolase [Spirochaetia bacterium]|nr:alpha-amylase family glycosyl hydrolase [Spirochaetia bacterium]